MKKKSLVLKYGLLMFAFIGLLFFLMKILHLESVKELRIWNIVFVVFFSIRMARESRIKEGDISYLQGLFSIFLANMLAVALIIIALFIYVNIYPDFVDSFSSWLMAGGDPSLSKIVVSLLFEGGAGAVIVSFSVMQYYKRESVVEGGPKA